MNYWADECPGCESDGREMNEIGQYSDEDCPKCHGTGEVSP